MAGNYQQMVELLEQSVELNPAFDRIHLLLACGYANLGRLDDAAWSIEEVLTLRPELTLEIERTNTTFRHPEDTDRYIQGLQKAGLPPH